MPNIRRFYLPNSIIFITAVTRYRKPFLQPDKAMDVYWETLKSVQALYPFHLLAYVILPDHFHWLMTVEDQLGNFSKVLHSFKRNYTWNYKRAYQIPVSMSLWQRGFWDHVIRNEDDLTRHFDYIHWNAVKHGFVSRPEDWQHSSYAHWFERNYYQNQWGWNKEPRTVIGMDLE